MHHSVPMQYVKLCMQIYSHFFKDKGSCSVFGQLMLYRVSCSIENVNCVEELQNEENQISQELKEVINEIQELAPYYTLCL